MKRSIVHAAGAVSAVLACASPPGPEPVLERIEPAHGLLDRETAVALIGMDLDMPVVERGPDLVVERWRGEVGGRLFVSLTWVSPQRLEGVVPAGLSEGEHDVVLSAAGRKVMRARAFRAVSPRAPRIDVADPPRVSSVGGRIILRGAGFHPPLSISVRARATPVSWIDERTLAVDVPTGDPGAAVLEVETPVGRARRGDLLVYEE